MVIKKINMKKNIKHKKPGDLYNNYKKKTARRKVDVRKAVGKIGRGIKKFLGTKKAYAQSSGGQSVSSGRAGDMRLNPGFLSAAHADVDAKGDDFRWGPTGETGAAAKARAHAWVEQAARDLSDDY